MEFMNHTYIIRDKFTKEAKFEFFSPNIKDNVNIAKYEVVTALQHLQELSSKTKLV
jgi:hypothetical protein